MDKQYFFIGIDVGKTELVVAVDGRRTTTFKNTKRGVASLYNFAAKLAGDLVPWFVMESSGVYSSVPAIRLYEKYNALVSVINPGRVKAHARAVGFRSKTDSQDAQVILDYARKTKLYYWKPAPPTLRILKQYVDQIRALKKLVVITRNRMEAHGFAGVEKLITKSDKSLIRHLERQIAKLETSIKVLVADDELLDQQVTLLKTIPGIAQDSACRIMAYTRGEITQRSAKQLTAFAGLAPAHRQSGTSLNGQSRIDKQGCAPLRVTLYMCALSAATHNPELSPLYQRLITRKTKPLAKKQAQVAVMRKLLLIARAVLVSGKPFDRNYHAATA
jgi:transposase